MTQKFPLQVVVTGQDAGATAMLRRVGRTAREQMRTFRASSTSAGDGMRALGGGVASLARTGLVALGGGLVAAGAGALHAAHSFVEVGSELDDFRQKTGLTVEQIQEWRYATGLAGVSTESFNKGLLTFTRGLGAARSGTGKLASGLKKVSPELLDQLKKTTDVEEALRIYLAAMEQLEDPTRRLALGTLAFGGAAADMTLAASAGSEELRRLRDEKRRDGVMSTEQAGKAADLGDKVDRLKSKWEGFKLTIGSVTADALYPHLEALAEWASQNEDVIAQNIAGAVDALGDAFGSIDWALIGDGIRTVFDVLKGVKEVALDVAEAIRLIPTDVNDMPWTEPDSWPMQAIQWLDEVTPGPSIAPRNAGPTLDEQLVRWLVASGTLTPQQGQQAARNFVGFGLTNLGEKGPGGILGESAVKQRAIQAPALPERLAGALTIKVEAAPGTTATVTKDTTAPSVKVQETGKRSVGGRL